MKESWEIKKLGDICEILDRLRKPITKKDRVEGIYPYYGATGILSYINNYIFDEKLVLIGEDGAKWTSGEHTSFIVDGKYWVNNHAHVIRPNHSVVVDDWIVYFLNFTDLTKYVTGLTVPKLNQEKLRSITIPVPPLPEQQRIVSILDEAFVAIDKAIANAEQNLKNAKELFESYLNFEFKKVSSEVCEAKLQDYVTDFLVPQRDKPKIFSGNIPWCRIEDFDGIYLQGSKSNRFVSEETISKMGLKVYPINTVIVSCSADLGRCAIIKKPLVTNQTFIGLVPSKNLNPLYLYFYMINLSKKLNEMASGATIKYLSKKKFQELTVNIPSLARQQMIAENIHRILKNVGSLKNIYQQKIDDLEELKKSILQKAFNGELEPSKKIAV